MFEKIAVALAFSPRLEALICETQRMARLFEAAVVFIHVGAPNLEEETILRNKLQAHGFNPDTCKIIWEEGEPTPKIIEVCNRENIDLLITGALKKEPFFRQHFGSVARKMIRKGNISLLVLLEPQLEPRPFREIVINGTDHERTPEIIAKGIEIAKIYQAHRVHILNEVQLLGLRMSMAGEGTHAEAEKTRRSLVHDEVAKIEHILKTLDAGDLKINIKIVSGKPGHEIARFSEIHKADLLILRSPDHKLNILDRLFPHDLEYILEDLPANLLIIHPKRKVHLWRP
jgi:nucleotide-binding universal stress UspA family protein